MIHQLQKKLSQEYGETPTEEQIQRFIRSTVYLCSMYWLHRTDKLWDRDYPLYLWLTNNMTGIAEESKLSAEFLPRYGNEPLFKNQYSHTQLKTTLTDNLEETFMPAPTKPKSKWRQFIQYLQNKNPVS